MASPADKAMQSVTQLPEWETPKKYIAEEKSAQKEGMHAGDRPPRARWADQQSKLKAKFDQIMPNYRSYCGLRRRTLLIVLLVLFLSILGLVIGLSVGLTKRNSSNLFIPLPSGTAEYVGDLTYYGPGLGACGVTSSDTDNIVAISHYVYDAVQVGSNPNTNPLCGLQIRAERFDTQVNAMRSVDLTIVDRCTGCKPTDIDVSPGVFAQLADPAQGRVTVTWAYLDPTPTPT